MMYYLLTDRPLQSALGTLIMLSGLLIYAIFRKRADRPATASAPGRAMKMFASFSIGSDGRGVAFAVAQPARAADTVTADDTARFLAGMPPSAGFAADAADQGSDLAASRTIF